MSLLLALHVLDRQLVSADGVLCGKVDDIELAPEDGSLRTAAVLSGSAAWPDRLPAPLRAGARSPSGPAGPFGFGPDPRLLTSDR